jgi:hypothetical protein
MVKKPKLRPKSLSDEQIVQIVLGVMCVCMFASTVILCIFVLRKHGTSLHLNDHMWSSYNSYMEEFFYSLGAEFTTQSTERHLALATEQNSYGAMLALLSEQHEATLHMLGSSWDPEWGLPGGHWQSMPISGTGQHSYNPSFVPLSPDSGLLIMREENSSDFRNCEAYYWSAPVVWRNGRPRLRTGREASPCRLQFQDKTGRPFTSLHRRNATVSAPVVEDLRPVRGTTAGLVSGVLFQGYTNDVCQGLLQLDTAGKVATLLARFRSPENARVEKNWLFVRHDDERTDVLYRFDPSLEVYTFRGPTAPNLRLLYSHPSGLPAPWSRIKEALAGQVSHMRLSALFAYGLTEWVLLLHLKCEAPGLMNYLTFAVHLDRETYRPLRYLPQTLLTESGIGVAVAMDGRVDTEEVHVLHGISDRISGTRSYPKTDWESRLRPWDISRH